MDPIYPWLDPVEVRRLAERLVKPGREPSVTAADAGFDDAFVGFANERAATVVPAPQPAAPELVRATEVPVPPEPPVASSLVARGPFLDRIKRFRDWMHQNFAATGVFILDREGEVIFDESHHGRLHFLARSLALASRRPGASAGNVHVKIGAGATLEVIPVDTAYGCLVLGAVVPDSLPPASIVAVMEALSLVAAPPGEDAKP
ncbi:MAG: hypothetical protein ACRDBP_09740 [Luteolibacter sp.]